MNRFGKISRFEIVAACSKHGKTFIKDSFFTSPFKIMKPFFKDDGSIFVFQQSSSPGILAGDIQEHRIMIEENVKIEILSQSFEKIFKMADGEEGKRKIHGEVAENATLIYEPLPCIPFAGSDFHSEAEIFLKDESSRLVYEDILCGGRIAHGEIFDYRSYQNLIEVRRKGKLIFRDNSFFEGSDGGRNPEAKKILQSEIMFSDFSHSGMLLIFGFEKTLQEIREILNLEEKLLYAQEKSEPVSEILCEASETDSADIVIRAFSHSAESIQNLFDKVKDFIR